MRNRSVIEMMVLAFTLLVGIAIISLSGTVIYVLITDSDSDVDRLVATLSSMISAILGALLGLIAGRATTSELHERPDDTLDDVTAS